MEWKLSPTSHQVAKLILREVCWKAVDEEELKQEELAAALSLSRIPVREALCLLYHDGYAIRKPNRHVYTYALTKDFLQENIRLLAVVEAELLQVLKSRDIRFCEITDALDENMYTAAEGHRRLAQLSPNPYLCYTLLNMIDGYFDIISTEKDYHDYEAFVQLLRRCSICRKEEIQIEVQRYYENWLLNCGEIRYADESEAYSDCSCP